jgi:site-specific DNA recombinase
MYCEPQPVERQRCAIYTRKSILQGLELEFNSLETQRAICSAYVSSQRHKGWIEMPTFYDDGGQSGATLDRPELRHLLADIERGLVDVVVVYKLDRITRTLLDFVRLIDFFEQYGVSFVSITQNFDTGDSMGRLILNVLLTFAQFEREILSDRIRDKHRIIRESGRWAGGATPMGYRVEKHMLHVVEPEAETVRFIFRRFVELNNYGAVADECDKMGLRGRCWITKSGRLFGNHPIGSGSVWKIISNPIYIGMLRSGGELLPGLHEPIIDRALWERAQQLRSEHLDSTRVKKRRHNLLAHMLYDCFGRSMCAHYWQSSNGTIYGHYVSNQTDWGSRHGHKSLRVRADALEDLVRATLVEFFASRDLIRAGLLELGRFGADLDTLASRSDLAAKRLTMIKKRDYKNVVQSVLARVELSNDRLKAVVRWSEVERYLSWNGVGMYKHAAASDGRSAKTYLLDVPCSAIRSSRQLRMPIEPRGRTKGNPDSRLLRLVHEARHAQSLVDENRASGIGDLAKRMRVSDWRFARILHLNYLAPDIITAILDGTHPRGLTRKKILTATLPLDWALQRRMLGFAPRPGRDGY